MLSDQDENYVIGLRRDFHLHPELGGKEEWTYARIVGELQGIGIPYERVGDYGVLATLEGKSSGKTVVLRADIDALPIEEDPNNLTGRKKVVSEVGGVAHLCGHDGHTAMLLCASRILHGLRDRFDGKIIFAFEYGEEVGLGAEPILDELAKRHVDGVWGIHLRWDLPTGKISVDSGLRMSGGGPFNVVIRGKGSHGSAPDLSIDPIECTAQIIVGLSSVLSREISPSQAGVLTIGRLSAGTAGNVIPDTARFSGSYRVLNPETGEKIKAAVIRIVEGTAAAHRCKAEIEIKGPGIPVVNDPRVSSIADSAARKAVGGENVISAAPWMASDSMGRYLQKYPGVYAFLGIRNEQAGTGAPHHNAQFDIDEPALKNGVAATVQFALDFLVQA